MDLDWITDAVTISNICIAFVVFLFVVGIWNSIQMFKQVKDFQRWVEENKERLKDVTSGAERRQDKTED